MPLPAQIGQVKCELPTACKSAAIAALVGISGAVQIATSSQSAVNLVLLSMCVSGRGRGSARSRVSCRILTPALVGSPARDVFRKIATLKKLARATRS